MKRVAFVLAAAFSGLGFGGQVWTVGGANPDYLDIQSAVEAAQDGDVVLVRPGTYAAFAIFDRSLTVAARTPGMVQVDGQVRVQALSPGKRVALIDLNVSGNGEHALRLADSLGSVRVVGGAWKGTDNPPGYNPPNHGVYASDCADLSFEGCTLLGGKGGNASLAPLKPPGPGGHGLYATGCQIALHGSTLRGGNGGGDHVGEGYAGQSGGSGALLEWSFLHCASTQSEGGSGGAGSEEDGFPPFGNPAKNGGAGGHGIWLVGSTGASAEAELLEATLLGGAGGSGGQGYSGPSGSPGPPGQPLLLGPNASASTLPWSARRVSAPGVWRVGNTVQVKFQGPPGELLFLLRSNQTAFKPSVAKKGVVLLGGFACLDVLGPIPASGQLTQTFNVGSPASRGPRSTARRGRPTRSTASTSPIR